MIIRSFTGEYEFLSNFYKTLVYYKGLYYPTSEHAYQAAKTLIPGEMDLIRNCKTPGQAKRMASKKAKKITLRSDWNSIRYDVMLEIVRNKFKDSELSKKLLDTVPNVLIEDNTHHDNYWGNCICEDCKNEVGLNMLGIVLMAVRGELIVKYFENNGGKNGNL